MTPPRPKRTPYRHHGAFRHFVLSSRVVVVAVDMSASSASPFPFDFTCVRIPEDDSEECAEVTLTATQAGDLSKLLKQRFAGGAITNAEPLLASYGMDAVREKMDALTAVGAAGSVESRALVKPSSTTLPAPYSAVFMYYDEVPEAALTLSLPLRLSPALDEAALP